VISGDPAGISGDGAEISRDCAEILGDGSDVVGDRAEVAGDRPSIPGDPSGSSATAPRSPAMARRSPATARRSAATGAGVSPSRAFLPPPRRPPPPRRGCFRGSRPLSFRARGDRSARGRTGGKKTILRYKSLSLRTNLLLAPLAGYTDLAFRRVVREQGGVGLATTEVVNARALLRHAERSRQFTRTTPDDRPLAVQIDGGDPRDLVAAARVIEEQGYDVVDINMGCPVARLTNLGGGSAWTTCPARAAAAVAEVAAAVRIPVTVKMRLGWDDANITAPALAAACEAAGAAAIMVHGRTRAQGFSGRVRLEGIAAVVAAVRAVPVIGNGDVTSPEDARRMIAETGCAGVSIGRAALTDPWIFARTDAYLRTGVLPPGPSFAERLALARRHFELLFELDGEHRACVRFRRAGVWYGPALGATKEYRRRVGLVRSRAEVEAIFAELEAGGMRRRRRDGALDERAGDDVRVPVPSGPIDIW
jgi:nifR3 family TIM-barrel protein